MKRRDTLKTLLIGGVGAAGIAAGVVSCKEDTPEAVNVDANQHSGYGRTKAEELHDKLVDAEGPFFTEPELGLIATLSDLILPATPTAGSATEAEVPAFIDFIVRDLPYHQVPIQGGLMWLNGESIKRFDKVFDQCEVFEQKQILDDIAYPAETDAGDEFDAGRVFFTRFRNLVLSGYYTTRIGLDDVGYVGNFANLWDGVPDDVMAKHGFAYDENIKYVDHATRDIKAEWDDNGNLLT